MRTLHKWLMLLLAVCVLCPPLAAQTVAPTRSADFIVAVINSEPLTNAEVQAMRNRLLRELRGRNASLPSAQDLTQQALQQLIAEKIQLQQAQEQGIKIDDEQIDQAEAGMAASNQLSLQAFRDRLRTEGLSSTTLREQIRQQLMLARLREREVESRIRISDQDIQQYLRELQAQDSPPELNIAMILIAVPEGADERTVQSLQLRAQDIARRARAGEDFAALAKAHSQTLDRGARGGEMGLRSADRYPELFVQAVAGLAVQGVSEPVRSGAGFHVLKLLERRQGELNIRTVQTRARHILLRTGPTLSREQALAQLAQWRQQISSGQLSFARAAREYSQDGSAAQGGDLGWASPGQFVPEFERVMNRLEPGQISEPLVSRFGVHLIEVMERRQVAVPERELRDMARATLREQRLEEAYERWATELRGRAYIEMREPAQVLPLPGR